MAFVALVALAQFRLDEFVPGAPEQALPQPSVQLVERLPVAADEALFQKRGADRQVGPASLMQSLTLRTDWPTFSFRSQST